MCRLFFWLANGGVVLCDFGIKETTMLGGWVHSEQGKLCFPISCRLDNSIIHLLVSIHRVLVQLQYSEAGIIPRSLDLVNGRLLNKTYPHQS